MKSTQLETAVANKLKKWLKTAKETETETRFFGLPVTRLTSIKSLCKDDETSAEKFALFITRKVAATMEQGSRPERFSTGEWESDQAFMREGIEQMEQYLAQPSSEKKQEMMALLKKVEDSQGDDIRNVHWTTVHFVRSGYLLKLEYALRCFVNHDFPYWVYKLAREYVEQGNGITQESVPMLLEVAEFWCQYYFSQSLTEKFPQFVPEKSHPSFLNE